MPFQELLSARRIGLLDDVVDRDGVLDAAAHLLAQPGDGLGLSVSALAAGLREREQLASTAIGHGVAVPHARMDLLEHSRGAFLRLRSPVDFAAADGQAVDLVFALAVPAHYVQQHLEQLADVAEQFGNAPFRETLRHARSTEDLCRCLLGD